MVDISGGWLKCDRCGADLTEGWARITNADGTWNLCYDPKHVTCYDAHLMDAEYGPF